jgi:hypothetical protein
MKNPFKGMFDFMKHEPPYVGINEGDTVLYLGVEWTVTRRFYSSSSCCEYTISRISKFDKVENISLPYYSNIAKLKESKP